ncbi:MAG: hypothetical protein JSV47_11335 [Deltaproteobacteria bacterium]|nr:MAG: hypothetical protein JSV47_11335 [Deltaproteobacteria bacterium]
MIISYFARGFTKRVANLMVPEYGRIVKLIIADRVVYGSLFVDGPWSDASARRVDPTTRLLS